jgi:hypothetical protein
LTSANTLRIAWPAPSTGYGLEQNADLTTTNWTSVTNTPELVGDEKQVVVSPSGTNRFYRLRGP